MSFKSNTEILGGLSLWPQNFTLDNYRVIFTDRSWYAVSYTHLDVYKRQVMTLSIYNTLSKVKEPFKPLIGNQVRMYVCGMTVYDFCHIGHARVMVAFDVVTRWLRQRGYDVTYVRNITDIDDKIIKRANENGEPFEALVERMIAAMHEDEARLNVLRPDIEPRATGHIAGMHQMIPVSYTHLDV